MAKPPGREYGAITGKDRPVRNCRDRSMSPITVRGPNHCSGPGALSALHSAIHVSRRPICPPLRKDLQTARDSIRYRTIQFMLMYLVSHRPSDGETHRIGQRADRAVNRSFVLRNAKNSHPHCAVDTVTLAVSGVERRHVPKPPDQGFAACQNYSAIHRQADQFVATSTKPD